MLMKRQELLSVFKKYVLDSSDYFAASAVMMAGNSYGGCTDYENSKKIIGLK